MVEEETYLRNQDLVARLHANSDSLAILVVGTRSNSKNLGLVELLDSRLGKEDTAGSLGLGFYALHEDAVEERGDGLDRLCCDGGLKTGL